MSVPPSPTPLFDTFNNTVKSSTPILPTPYLSDYQHAYNFLYTYRGSQDTFTAYRREIERLLQWARLIPKKSIKTFKRTDVEDYIHFCQTPPAKWIGSKNVSRFITRDYVRVPNPEWRPFVSARDKEYNLSQSALQSIFAILSSFYNYLEQEGYVDSNPVAQIRQKSKFLRAYQGSRAIRRLSELQWIYVIETAELMANENPGTHERTLFIVAALYGMYLRISELASSARWTPQMGHFYRDNDNNWWFKTLGKGNKERTISVSNAMLDALKRYRTSLGLSSIPHPGDTSPLILDMSGKNPISCTRHIRKIVQQVFDKASERLLVDGFSDDAETMRAATVHWLRHTGISDDVKQRPREHVRDDAGHSSSATTDKYIDIELRARHASAKNKLISLKG